MDILITTHELKSCFLYLSLGNPSKNEHNKGKSFGVLLKHGLSSEIQARCFLVSKIVFRDESGHQ